MNTIQLHLSERAAAVLDDLARARQRRPEDVASEVLSHQLEAMKAEGEAVIDGRYAVLRRRALEVGGGRAPEEIDRDLRNLRGDR
ncbi:hypothetical protein [Rhizobium sp. SG2393]|uniref:hypothetical protein n=1 Tax=Rhizobium sp. SG2393 TaxID=3276279 RepID=UPI0036732549